VLFCSDNRFTELPACLGQCAKLSMIGFKANQISHVPAAALPPQLRWLILTDNCISQLPDELGQRPLLQKLMLAGNHWPICRKAWPSAKPGTDPHRLQPPHASARVAAGAAEPDLAGLRRQSGGNRADVARMTPRRISPGRTGNGRGAGRRRFRGDSQGAVDTPALPVAVKLYKGTITSDGSPLHEMKPASPPGCIPT
jgi:hypothetical protein